MQTTNQVNPEMSFDLHDAILSITNGQEEDSSHHAVAAALCSLTSSALCSLLLLLTACCYCGEQAEMSGLYRDREHRAAQLKSDLCS